MRTTHFPALSLMLCLVGGCAPSVQQLLADRHFDEAVCAVSPPDTPPEEQQRTARELTRQLGVAVHLHPVSEQELETLLGDKAAPIRQKLVVVRVRWQSNLAPLEEIAVIVRMTTPTQPLVNLAGDRDKLASIAGETLPEPTTEQYGPDALTRAGDAVHNAAAVGAAIMKPLTLGISSAIFGDPQMAPARPHGERQVGPTHAQYMKASPITEAMYVAMPTNTNCRGATGRVCDGFVVLPRPVDQRAPFKVELSVTYGGNFSLLDTCQAYDAVDVVLPPGATLEERIKAAFGTKMRRVDELRTAL